MSDLWWFALLGAATMLAGLLVSGRLVGRLRGAGRERLAKLLFGLTALQIVTVVGFGLAGSFTLAVVTYLVATSPARSYIPCT